ncbi:MAG: CPBP family glutamic-type intramembrane protease [Lapillicoccus sp.]
MTTTSDERRATRPGARTPPADKFDERRNQLAESALTTLGELGYARSSLREIAANSPFSHGVVHYYFHDKFELIVYCVRYYKARCVHRYDAVVTDSTSAAGLLDAFTAKLQETLRDEAPMHRLWYDLRAQSMFEESLREAVTMIDRTLEEMIWRVVSRYAELAGREPVATPAAAYGMLDGVFQQALLALGRGDESILQTLSDQVHALLPLIPAGRPASHRLTPPEVPASAAPHRVPPMSATAESLVDAAPEPVPPERRSGLRREVLIVLGLSLGASALYAVLQIIDRLTQKVALSQQTSSLNNSVTPDRPYLDLAYQLTGYAVALVPVAAALYLLRRVEPPAPFSPSRFLGFDWRRPTFDLGGGVALAAVIGIPGLGLYVVARAIGINTQVAAANLVGAWWTIPVLVLSAVQNAVLEEVVVVGYLVTRLRQVGWALPLVVAASAVLRGSYHLYQGFGAFIGNAVMGVVFVLVFLRWRRIGPLVVAHTLLDLVAFIGYTLAKGHLSWLQ